MVADLRQRAVFTGMQGSSHWFRATRLFTTHSHTRVIALPQDIALYEPFCCVFECGLCRNLVYKRSWGFLELFFSLM